MNKLLLPFIGFCLFSVVSFSQTVTITDKKYDGPHYTNGEWLRELIIEVNSSEALTTTGWSIDVKFQREFMNTSPLDPLYPDDFKSPNLNLTKLSNGGNWLRISPTDPSKPYTIDASGTFKFSFVVNSALVADSPDTPNGSNPYQGEYIADFPGAGGLVVDIEMGAWVANEEHTKIHLDTKYNSVGIGVIDPTTTLDVVGLTKIAASETLGGDVLQLHYPNVLANGRNHYMFFSNRYYGDTESPMYSAIGAFEKGDNGEGPADLILQPQWNGGNLGIGNHTASPLYRLSVVGTGYFSKTLTIGAKDSWVNQEESATIDLIVNGEASMRGNGDGGDVLKLYSEYVTSNGKDHYLFLGNRKFSDDNDEQYSVIGAWEKNAATGQEKTSDLLIQPQWLGGNLGVGYHATSPASKLSVKGSGYFSSKVGIGLPTSDVPNGYLLGVNGGILAEKVKVAIYGEDDWSDFVFADDYELLPLNEVEQFIKKNKHLPEVPSAKEMVSNGLDVAATDALLLQKIEELTLYMIEMDKEIEILKKENKELKAQIK